MVLTIRPFSLLSGVPLPSHDVFEPEDAAAVGVVFYGDIVFFIRIVIELFGQHGLPFIGSAGLTLGDLVAVYFITAVVEFHVWFS